MKIKCTKQTWCIKVSDAHKRFEEHHPGIDTENDADILQYAIWFAYENIPDERLKTKYVKIWKALIHGKTIEI